jgi:hypothetical protein
VIRWSLFLALAAGLVAYSFWLYLRVELPVRGARVLAAVRAVALLLILLMLFDVRLPGGGAADGNARWVLLDASLSMSAAPQGARSPWDAASSRALELEDDGWSLVTFGSEVEAAELDGETGPVELRTLLAPALQRAVEAGVRQVRVLSDLRFEDEVAVRSSLASLPLDVVFERFGEDVVNAGISRLDVPDLARPEGSVTAEVEVHAAGAVDSLEVGVMEEDRLVAQVTVAAPSPGLTALVPVALPTPRTSGRVRYTASVSVAGDAFASDDTAVAYASVGHQEGALVLLSLRPDWEPRHLLPVLADVTGLPVVGYFRVGPNAFVPMGRVTDRGAPVDSATVGRAARDAAILVLHGLGSDADVWARALTGRPGRSILFPIDAEGATLAGVPSGQPRPGEWYASGDIPTSPIAGALSGVQLQGLPPLSDVLIPNDPTAARGVLLVQLRGAGAPAAAIHLEENSDGRVAVALASGFWRWAARDTGLDAYRRLWSGIAGWLLAGESTAAAEPRPTRWVVARGQPVTWGLPTDSLGKRIVVSADDDVVVDTTVAGGGTVSTGVLPPGRYTYRVDSPTEGPLAEGRFDVAASTPEMRPAAVVPEPTSGAGTIPVLGEDRIGRPLRTSPWPYLLVIMLLCGEWIGRRRSGLR